MMSFGNASPWNVWRLTVSLSRGCMKASGNLWTHCVTRSISKIFGKMAVPHGKPGKFLERKACFCYRSYRLQGKLACDVAETPGCACGRLCLAAARDGQSFYFGKYC